MIRTSLISVFLIGLATAGCLDLSTKKPSAKEKPADKHKADDANPRVPSPNNPSGQLPSDTDPDDPATPTGPSDLDQMISDCGIKNTGDLGDNDLLYNKTLVAIPNRVFTVTATTSVEITVTKVEYKRETNTKIDSYILPSLAQKYFGNPSSGVVSAKTVPFSEVSQLQQIPAWSKIFCTFVGATELTNDRGGKHVVVKFDPPFPIQMSSLANAKRYAVEVGDKKVFSNIKATVVESDKPNITEGSEVIFNITVTKVPQDTLIEDETGNLIEVHADAAYRIQVRTDIIDEAEDAAFVMEFGLDPDMTYYVDHAQRTMLWSVMDTHSSMKGVIKFRFQ